MTVLPASPGRGWPGSHAWALVAILVGSLALRLAAALPLAPFQDEALYWRGARPAELSFCPHPPGAYLLVWAGTQVFGDSLLALRAGSLAFGTGAVLLAYLLGRELYGRMAGLWAAAMLTLCPAMAGAGAVATPDGLLIFLWLLCAWAAWRGIRRPSPGWWCLGGLALAAGLYTKYMMVLALPAGFLALCASAQGRRVLRTPWPWAAAAGGLALFLPVFLASEWSRGWPAVRYHLLARHDWSPSWQGLTHFVATHAAAYSPLLWVGALGALAAAARAAWRGEARAGWLAGFGLLPIAFFLLPRLVTKQAMMQVQWDSFGYAVGLVALSGVVAGPWEAPVRSRWRRGVGAAALAIACLATALVLVGILAPRVPLAMGLRPPGLQRLGWRELAARLATPEHATEVIVTDTFATAMTLGFHLGRRKDIYVLQHPRNQRYGLVEQLRTWRMDEARMLADLRGREALYVHEHDCFDRCDCATEPQRLRKLFQTVSPVDTVALFHGGQMMKCFRIYRVR
ncbi:MAG: glycosyltransferase family 39 protein [Planctomycetes bacterium]|nr:glycosyltransferase family 39 protein [Planctomycetota bacterium]